LVGETLGKYRIVEQVGSGGMASVFKAYQPGLDRFVAIKLMHTFLVGEEEFLERFQREARSVARLRHPNIVQVYDFDIDSSRYYMVMEFLEGPSLKNRMADLQEQGAWLELDEAVQIVRDVGEALDYAHGREMVHRDVKPANIMLSDNGGAILTDFGIVKMLGGTTHVTVTGAMVGTPAYMAPEQTTGDESDARADIYSLGVVLYQLVTGRVPFTAETPMALMLQHITAPLPTPRSVNPDLPEGVEHVILKALAKNPDERYQTVREMLTQLDRAMRGLPVPPVDPSITAASQPIVGETTLSGEQLITPAPVAAPPGHRIPAWVFGVAGAAIILMLLGGFAFLSGGGEATPTPELTEIAAAATALETPTLTGTPRPSNTPDIVATNRAATVDAFFLTANAPTATETSSPTPSATPAASNTPTPSATPTASTTPSATSTPLPTDTPDLTATAAAACVYDAALEGHVTIRPWQFVPPGTPFDKVWRLSNTGDCPWPLGSKLTFISGAQLGALDAVDVELAGPGEEVDVSVSMRAPNANGGYAGVWQLHTSVGEGFGEEITVEINVGPTPTPRPTNTPLPTGTPLATATPVGPLEMSVPSILPGSCWLSSDTGRWGGTLVWSAWGGTGEYEYYANDVKPEFMLTAPSYEFSSQVNHRWPGALYTVSGGDTVKVDRWVEPSECGY
jgi:serine/threonine protein kinase